MFKKFLSRKFLVTLGAIAIKILAPHTPDSVLIAAGGYVAGESIVDTAGAAARAAADLKAARGSVTDFVKDILPQVFPPVVVHPVPTAGDVPAAGPASAWPAKTAE